MSEEKTENSAPDEGKTIASNQDFDSGTVEKNTTVQHLTPLNIIAAIANGAGVGLLLGMLLGLAISPVVSGVIGTLSGLLAVLLGVKEEYITILKGIRVGAFGFFCVTGILWGMYIRTNNALLPSRIAMMEDYKKVGFTGQEARDFIAYREFNLVPSAWKGAVTVNKPEVNKEADIADKQIVNKADNSTGKPGTKAPDSAQKIAALKAKKNTSSSQPAQVDNARVFADVNDIGAERRSVLYSSEINGAACYKLSLINENQPASDIKDAFEKAGSIWKELAENLDKALPEKVYIHALLTFRDCLCESGQNGKWKISGCETVSKLSEKDSPEKIKQTLFSSGQTWKSIEAKVSAEIPAESQKNLYLSLVKILCHD